MDINPSVVIAVLSQLLISYGLFIVYKNPYTYRSKFWTMAAIGILVYIAITVYERSTPGTWARLVRLLLVALADILSCFLIFTSQVRSARINPAMVNIAIILGTCTGTMISVHLFDAWAAYNSGLVVSGNLLWDLNRILGSQQPTLETPFTQSNWTPVTPVSAEMYDPENDSTYEEDFEQDETFENFDQEQPIYEEFDQDYSTSDYENYEDSKVTFDENVHTIEGYNDEEDEEEVYEGYEQQDYEQGYDQGYEQD